MLEVSETQFKIIALLDNVAPENRNVSFLSVKVGAHQNTVRDHLKQLESLGVVKVGESTTGKKFYHLQSTLRKRVHEWCCIVNPPSCK